MKKRILIISILLFTISYIIVFIIGKENTFYYKEADVHDVNIKCNEEIVKCDTSVDNKIIKVRIKSKKVGKTNAEITYKRTLKNGETELVSHNVKVYVHKTGVITLRNYFGECNGGISFLISIYIIVLIIIIELIKKYIKNRNINLYTYKNIKILGIILYITGLYLFNFFLFIYDVVHGSFESINRLIVIIKDDLGMFAILLFPLIAIVLLLVMISNIKLILKEGKSLKNMLGIILSFLISFVVVGNSLFYIYIDNSNIVFSFISYLVYMYVVYIECILISTCILGFKAAKRIPKFNKDFIIILGCGIRKDGSLPPLLKSRVDRAIEFSKMQEENANKSIVFVPSGGQGEDEIISEAEAMKKYLIEQGINSDNIIIENKSKNTKENIRFSNEIIKKRNKKANIAFSTTNYHVFRTGIIATDQKILIEGIGSKTKPYYWVNAFIREFVAIMLSEKKSNLKIFIILFLMLLSNFIISHLIIHI